MKMMKMKKNNKIKKITKIANHLKKKIKKKKMIDHSLFF